MNKYELIIISTHFDIYDEKTILKVAKIYT